MFMPTPPNKKPVRKSAAKKAAATEKPVEVSAQDQADEAPVREFNTVIMTFDHTTAPRPDGHIIQKFVGSSEDLITSMLSLFSYYDEGVICQSKATIEQFQLAAQTEFPCFIYRNRENVQAVMSAQTFQALVSANEDSVFAATDFIGNTIGKTITETEELAGGIMPLILFAFDTE